MGNRCAESRSLGTFMVPCSTVSFSSHNLLPSSIPTGGYLSTGLECMDAADSSHKRQPSGFPIKGYLSVPSILSMGTNPGEIWKKAVRQLRMLPITGYL